MDCRIAVPQQRLDYLNQQLRAEQHSAQVFEDADAAMQEYWLVTGSNESELKAVPHVQPVHVDEGPLSR